jgi:flagellar basal body-associated protein FliL
MSSLIFILVVSISISFLCALLVISSAIVSSRSTKQLSAKQSVDLQEEAKILQTLQQEQLKQATNKPLPKWLLGR